MLTNEWSLVLCVFSSSPPPPQPWVDGKENPRVYRKDRLYMGGLLRVMREHWVLVLHCRL
jgi:hypothetical protein